jgi:hypothetical protein
VHSVLSGEKRRAGQRAAERTERADALIGAPFLPAVPAAPAGAVRAR